MGLSYQDCQRLGIAHLHPLHAGHSDRDVLRERFGDVIPMSYRLTIPGWHPATINQLTRSVKDRIRLKKRDRKIVCDYAVVCGVDPATGPRRVHLAITTGKGERAADGDAYWKSLLDALVHAKALIDDTIENAILDPVEKVRGREPETTIELFDL